MLFWILFLAIIFLTSYPYYCKKRKLGKSASIIGIIFIIFISAVRFDVGFDYQTYYQNIFPSLSPEIDNYEPISKLIIKSSFLLGSPQFQFIVFSILTYGIAYFAFYKYSKNLWISIILYMSLFYLGTLSTIRQGLAMSFIIYGIPYMLRKEWLKYIIVCIIASLTHSSALIALAFPLIFSIKHTSLFFVLFVIYNISFNYLFDNIANSPILSGYFWYMDKTDLYEGGTKTMYVMIIVVIINLFFSIKNNDAISRRLCYICLFGSIFPFYFGAHLGGRLALYFYLPLCFSIPLLINDNVKFQRICSVLCAIYFILLICIDASNPRKSSLTPYKTIFEINRNNPNWKQ